MNGRARIRVEFLGLPGSGKSTLSHAVAGRLRRHGVRVAEPTWEIDHLLSARRRYASKARGVAMEVLRGPKAAGRTLGAAVRSRQHRPSDTLRVTWNWLFIRSLAHRAPTGAAVELFDEGLFQALWTVCFAAEASDVSGVLDALVGAAAPPDLVVLLEVGSAEVRRRLASRSDGMSRMDGTAPDDPDAWWRACRALTESRRVLDALAAASGRPMLLRVSNEHPDELPLLAERLAALLLSAAGGDLRRAPMAAYLIE